MDDFLKEALLDAQGGSAICFLGAGFSRNTLTKGGVSVPDVNLLSSKIWDLLGETPLPNTPLSDLADACESESSLKQDLVDLLINSYTLCEPNEAQKSFLSTPWRAVFTTNFDDIAEQCVSRPQVITPSFDSQRLDPKKQPIYHLHGRAKDLIDSKSDPSIVISETNYLKIKDRNRDLYAALENEVHTASRIFFVGYSLRDAEIASRLFSIEGLNERSVVITAPGSKDFSTRRLSKFGKVYPIGLEGIVENIKDINSTNSLDKQALRLNFLEKVSPSPVASEISIDDVHRVILAGEFSYSAYARHQLDENLESPYCVSRKPLVDRVFKSISEGTNRVLISSDLGNGKTFMLKEISYAAHQKGYDVLQVRQELHEIYAEIDSVISQGGRKLFLIDDIIRHHRSARYIGQRLPYNCALVVSSVSIHGTTEYSEVINSLGGPVREIEANHLDSDQLLAWDNFLERWGFWEERIQDSQKERLAFLKDRCGSENRAIVVSTFRASAIAQKIKSIVEFFLIKNKSLSKAFIAILINSLCRNHVEWSRIVAWLEIDEPNLKKAILSSQVLNFMVGSKNWYSFTSTELAGFIFANYDFEISEIVEVYVKIVRETAYSANDPRSGFDSRENLKELMRFRFLTRLFSSPSDGSATINAVYHRLSNVPRIRDNDQFWLQYAMARMEINDLGPAETFINTSLGIAKKKNLTFSVRQILDQRCRLLFRKNTIEGRKHSKTDIDQAISDLVAALNSSDSIPTHPLRSSGDILNFVEAKIDEISQQEIENLISCIKLMQSKIPDGLLPKSQKGETKEIRSNISKAYAILASS